MKFYLKKNIVNCLKNLYYFLNNNKKQKNKNKKDNNKIKGMR